jgi:hypothetical protein
MAKGIKTLPKRTEEISDYGDANGIEEISCVAVKSKGHP